MLRKIYDAALDLLFPKTSREHTVERLANSELTVKLTPQNAETTAGVQVSTIAQYDSKRMRELIHSLKFYNSRKAAAVLARMLHDFLAETLSDEVLYNSKSKIIIAPVPLSARRKRERGYNQIERILDELINLDNNFKNFVSTDVLTRTRDTTPQTKLKRKRRLKNLKGAFSVQSKEAVRDAHVIVLDDIATTGATLAEIKRTLEVAGCPRVTLLALARA